MQYAPSSYFSNPLAANFADEVVIEPYHETGFVPSRAATPEPCSPGSRPLELRQPQELTADHPARFDPYSVYKSTSARRRPRTKDNKRSMNAFLFYRRAFGTMYPVIDMAEKQQGAKSAIIGALWRREPTETKEHFYRMQESAAEEFRVSHGVIEIPRADPLKALVRRDRARLRRAADDKLSPRSDLIVRLWEQHASDDTIIKALEDFDVRSGPKPKAESKPSKQKKSVPLANQTNAPVSADTDDSLALVPTTPLKITTSLPESAPTPVLSDSSSSPALSPTASSPELRTPSPAATLPSYYGMPVTTPTFVDAPFVFPTTEDKTYSNDVPDLYYPHYEPTEYTSGWPQMTPLLPAFQQPGNHPRNTIPWTQEHMNLTANADLLGSTAMYIPGQPHTLYDPAMQAEYFDNYPISPFDPCFALGSQDELSGLQSFDCMQQSFDGLQDVYVDMSCMPNF